MGKVVFAQISSKLSGVTNLLVGILSCDGMAPIGAGLHDPVLTCVPLVSGRPVVSHQLIKLFEDVVEGVKLFGPPAFATSNAVEITARSSATCDVYQFGTRWIGNLSLRTQRRLTVVLAANRRHGSKGGHSEGQRTGDHIAKELKDSGKS